MKKKLMIQQQKLELLDLEDDSEGDSGLEFIIDKLNREIGFDTDTETSYSDAESEFSISYKKREPYVSGEGEKGIHRCEHCMYETDRASQWRIHLTSKRHRRHIGELPMISKEFECKPCKYSTDSKSNYNVHLATRKHKEMVPYEKKIKVLVKRKLE